MKTATITFHASHNYGSMLQAYALQQVINELGHSNDIINLRTERQKRIYCSPNVKTRTFWKQLRHDILYFPFRKDLEKKYHLFESFLNEELRLTNKEFSSLRELENSELDYDCFIAGGDQIWNTRPRDFDWSYFLPFTNKKKISYAVSMGPHAEQQVTDKEKIKTYLSSFSHISVRELGTQNIVSSLVENKVDITLDPALLLSRDEWLSRFDQVPLIPNDYVLIYVPGTGYRKEVFDIAMSVRRLFHIDIYSTLFAPQMLLYPSLKYYVASGPWEFLNLLANAKLVVAGSFHAVAFSTLFKRPFLAVNGNRDNRIKGFLKKTGLLDRAIDYNSRLNIQSNILECDFSIANCYLKDERVKSLDFLKKAIYNG